MFRTYNKQVFHMLHAITLCYLNFVNLFFGRSSPPPPFFLFLEIHNHILINLPKIGLETPLTMAKKNLGLSNIKQTNNNRTAILSI